MKNNPPLISVIVPVYNVEQYLDRCINSILNQVYANIEIILVDDGSTDNSGKIADKYCDNDDRIRVIHKENGGLSSVRNEGVKYAHGDWIAFVDSDDYLKKQYLSILYNIAIKNNADIATCSFESFSDDGLILKKSPSWPKTTLSGEEAVEDMLKNRRPAYAWLNLIKKELFLDNGIAFPVSKEFEDIATKIKLLCCAKKVAYTDEKLYMYLIRKDSITGKKFSNKHYRDYVAAIEDAKKYLIDHEKSKSKYLEYFELSSLFTLMNYIAKDKNNAKMIDEYWKEIRKRAKRIYHKTSFPSVKKKALYTALICLSYNARLYSCFYRKVK